MQRSAYAAITFLGVGVLAGCSGSEQDGGSATAVGTEAFCQQLSAVDQARPREPGGNSAAELTDLLEASDDSIADAVETFQDYHRDVYIEGDDTTDTYDRLPADVREAVDRIDTYAEQHC